MSALDAEVGESGKVHRMEEGDEADITCACRQSESAASRASQETSVLVLVPTYMRDLGLYRRAFPNSRLVFSAILDHTPGIQAVPSFGPHYGELSVPFLSSHLRLMRDYWSVTPRWPPWSWLERELSMLRECGYHFRDGCLDEYERAIIRAAAFLRDFVRDVAREHGCSAICVYGRGHWTMNAAAVAAEEAGSALYIIERGILPRTYILDIQLPFCAPGSTFRNDWEARKSTLHGDSTDIRRRDTSYWDTYVRAEPRNDAREGRVDTSNETMLLLVGQCFFDYNLREAPYDSPRGFIEYCLSQYPDMAQDRSIVYRPHPLSPEVYPTGKIWTAYGELPVIRGSPHDLLVRHPVVITWNSLLGLEAWLFHGCAVSTLDVKCFYRELLASAPWVKSTYVSFLQERSIQSDCTYT
jgi:hypothetical protein